VIGFMLVHRNTAGQRGSPVGPRSGPQICHPFFFFSCSAALSENARDPWSEVCMKHFKLETALDLHGAKVGQLPHFNILGAIGVSLSHSNITFILILI
jgi:hypothetical protein